MADRDAEARGGATVSPHGGASPQADRGVGGTPPGAGRAEAAGLPAELRALFWDADTGAVDLEAHARYVIERVLDHGDEAAVRWLLRHYPAETVQAVVARSRSLSPKTRGFWRLYYRLREEDVPLARGGAEPRDERGSG